MTTPPHLWQTLVLSNPWTRSLVLWSVKSLRRSNLEDLLWLTVWGHTSHNDTGDMAAEVWHSSPLPPAWKECSDLWKTTTQHSLTYLLFLDPDTQRNSIYTQRIAERMKRIKFSALPVSSFNMQRLYAQSLIPFLLFKLQPTKIRFLASLLPKLPKLFLVKLSIS